VSCRARLSDGTVRVRRLRLDDVDALYEATVESIGEVYPWQDWCHPGYQRSEMAEWVEAQPERWESGIHSFVIEDVATGTVLGSTGVNRIDTRHRNANLGYWVRPSWTRRGVATRATYLTARFAFEDLDLIRAGITAAVDNLASRRVAERVGASFEGALRHGLMIQGEGRDAALYSLIRDDFPRFPSLVEEPETQPFSASTSPWMSENHATGSSAHRRNARPISSNSSTVDTPSSAARSAK